MLKSGASAANELLEGLTRDDYRRVFPDLTKVDLSFADVLSQPNATAKHVYFPTAGLIGIHSDTISRASLVLVGREGMVGYAVATGVAVPQALVMVQGAGTAMRMDAQRFRVLADRSASLQQYIHRYTYSLLKRASQMAVCNSFHSVEARLARCLLESGDQARSDEIRITQQALAHMIGARRSGVSIAATSMRRRHLIEYARGRLRIVDRRALKRLACACYGQASKH